jgi:hypothetical protein
MFAASRRYPVAFYRTPAEQQSETTIRYAQLIRFHLLEKIMKNKCYRQNHRPSAIHFVWFVHG